VHDHDAPLKLFDLSIPDEEYSRKFDSYDFITQKELMQVSFYGKRT
jgi:hypothetical protein